MKDKKKIEQLKELLGDCLHDLCQLCVRLNPQHEDCEQCDDTDYFREAINE